MRINALSSDGKTLAQAVDFSEKMHIASLEKTLRSFQKSMDKVLRSAAAIYDCIETSKEKEASWGLAKVELFPSVK